MVDSRPVSDGAVRVIFFDFGGVLVEHIARGIIAGLEEAGLVDPARADAAYEVLLDDELQRGSVSGGQLLERIEGAAGATVGAASFHAVLRAALARRIDPVWASAALLRKKHRVSIISDMPVEWLAIIREQHDLSLFSDPIFSSEVGMTKRGEGIFRHALERHHVEGRASLFIDDTLRNVTRARACGMNAVCFTDPQGLRDDLARLGLP